MDTGMDRCNLNEYIEAGRIVSTHALAGEVKFEVWCDSPLFLKKIKKLYFDPAGQSEAVVVSLRPQGNMAILRLKDVDGIDAARALRNKILYFDRKDAALPDGSFYICDLIGLEVKDSSTGQVYGTLTDVTNKGASDIYIISTPTGEKMMPAVDEFVKKIIPGDGIYITPIEGLFE